MLPIRPPDAPDRHPAPLSRRRILAGAIAAACAPAVLLARAALAQVAASLPARALPARALPVPDTVSDAMRPVVGAPLAPGWNDIPGSDAAWRQLAADSASQSDAALARIRRELGVTVENRTIAGVPVFVSTPADLPPENRNRLLMHLHGGGYVLYPGLAGAGEGMMMAGYGRFRVVSVDYRMAPDHPFPAAVEDAITVWTALLAETNPARMAIFGTSAGGGLTLAMLLRARAEGLAFPAAIAPGSPWVDLTEAGDTIRSNAYVDNVLVSITGWAGAAGRLYAGREDPRNPLISPIFGDFSGFPPAILTSGTRDLLLSHTVRAHRKLRQAGVPAELQVFEALSHAQYLTPFTPETAEAFAEIARFFDRHLAR